MRSGFTVEANNYEKLLNDLIEAKSLPFCKTSPNILHKDHDDEKAGKNWVKRVLEWVEPKHSVSISWGKQYEGDVIFYDFDSPMSLGFENFELFKFEVLKIFRELAFEIISISKVYSEWFDIDYTFYGFANGHGVLGLGCAFQKSGHQRLVSRRYLDYGPWLVTRDEEHDISLIQFHDLEADALTALEQAKPGHKLMADAYEGIFIQRDYQIINKNFKPLYEANTKTIKIVVYGREVTKAEMLDACATRYWQLLGADKSVERAAFVFIDENEARANLLELWLRELECWAIIKGVETRLDLDYVPPSPVKPDWVNHIKDTSST